jgi:hypothetical protein
MSAESNHAISVQATKDKIMHLLRYCRTCRTKNCLPAEHAEIMSRNQILQFLCKPTKETRLCICSGIAEHAGQHNCFACHKRQDCAFAQVFAEHAGQQNCFACRTCGIVSRIILCKPQERQACAEPCGAQERQACAEPCRAQERQSLDKVSHTC